MNLRYTYVRKTKGIVLEYSYLYTAVFNTVSQQSSYSKKWVPEERQGLQQSFISTLAVNSLFPKPCQVARGLVVCWISWHAWPPPSNFSCRKSTFHSVFDLQFPSRLELYICRFRNNPGNPPTPLAAVEM